MKVEQGCLHNVLNVDDITPLLQMLDLGNYLSEIYSLKLGCYSLWDTLYTKQM